MKERSRESVPTEMVHGLYWNKTNVAINDVDGVVISVVYDVVDEG